MEWTRGSIPSLVQWIKDLVLHELWCRSQMQLGSGVAVAMVWASGYSSGSTPSLGTSICHGRSPKKKNQNKTVYVADNHCYDTRKYAVYTNMYTEYLLKEKQKTSNKELSVEFKQIALEYWWERFYLPCDFWNFPNFTPKSCIPTKKIKKR